MENMERLGTAADTVRNLLGSLELPMPPAFHVEQMKRELFKLMDELRAVYIAETGDNPWL
jgi:hypothetical protein